MKIVKSFGPAAVAAFVVAFVIALLTAGCSKEKTPAPIVSHDYTGQWVNVVKTPEGPLDFFIMKLLVSTNNTGTSEFVYTSPYHTYPQTNLTWKKIAGDSVVITLNIPAYPDETWELRGLANSSNTQFTADYFSIPNNNAAGKWKYGKLVFTH